ncbi:outer membrane protein assembly factor BamB family protein [Streptomyces sp. NBC_01431]|uniref:outer membrane protein assembly factor BamB family protein n=1 Tax=Streptomyces sp. NBC_01431 TaxID=2903863 RepID=UPI002E2F0FF9|nr:PQQ-binding-like beta-propeller repeat protein [Streptomyces sp. NBC_01431]
MRRAWGGRSVVRMAVCAVAAGVTLSACTGGGPGTADKDSPRKAFDPPVRFGSASGVEAALSAARQPSTSSGDAARPAVSLAEGVAYVAGEDGLEAVDTATGSSRWKVGTTNPVEQGGFGTPRAAPLVVAGQSGATVFAAYDRTIAVQGTALARAVIEVLAVDARSGKAVWHGEFMPAPSARFEGRGLAADGNVAPQVIAADTSAVVVTAAETTYALDRSTGALRWKQRDFRAVSVSDGVVAGGESSGYEHGQLAGFALDSGQRRWTAVNTASRVGASAAGRGLLAGNDRETLVLVDARTGAERARYADGGHKHVHPWRCLWDTQSLVLCRDQLGGQVNALVVFDTSTVRKVWALPDASGRIVPEVTAVWHGAVYGRTGNGPVVLDGRTGKDRDTRPGAAPFEVDQYAGLAGNNGSAIALPASA